MRVFIFTLLLLLSSECFAQSDYLVVRLKSGGSDTIKVSEISLIKFENVTSVNETQTTLTDATNFPNPFSESTTIEFDLKKSENAAIMIYDNTDNLIRKLICRYCH
jgi:hypothetical protein